MTQLTTLLVGKLRQMSTYKVIFGILFPNERKVLWLSQEVIAVIIAQCFFSV